MRIVYGKVYTPQGVEIGEEWIDTSDPGVPEAFEAWAASEGPSNESGWNEMSNHPDYPNHTRYQVLVAEMKRQNDFEGLKRLRV